MTTDEISAVAIFLNIASHLRRLEIFIDSLSSKSVHPLLSCNAVKLTTRPMTPTHHSLIHALSTCLTYIKQELTSAIEESNCQEAPALLGCSRGLDDMGEMLRELCDIIQWVRYLSHHLVERDNT